MHFLPAQEEPARQIEITVKEISIPGDGDQRAAHESGHRAWIEVLRELLHVVFKIARGRQPEAESSQRDIGKGVKVVKDNPPLVLQTLTDPFFRLSLWGWQKSSGGIRDQVKLQPGLVMAIADGVQLSQSVDAGGEGARAPLRIRLRFTQ